MKHPTTAISDLENRLLKAADEENRKAFNQLTPENDAAIAHGKKTAYNAAIDALRKAYATSRTAEGRLDPAQAINSLICWTHETANLMRISKTPSVFALYQAAGHMEALGEVIDAARDELDSIEKDPQK